MVVNVCRHLLKEVNRREVHFVSCRGNVRFGFCLECFSSLMKQASYNKPEIDTFIKRISTPFEMS
jgi:hypothetical protein